MLDIQCISKGFYQHSQINDFVSVKNYIFAAKDRKKYLLIQFYNDLKHAVNEMEYTVIQIDAAGKEIGRTDIKRTNTVFYPSSTYISSEGIPVSDKCCDFKVVFKSVRAARYLYTVNGGLVSVAYLKKIDDPSDNAFGRYLSGRSVYSVTPRRFGKPKLAALFASLALLTIIGLNIYQILVSLLA